MTTVARVATVKPTRWIEFIAIYCVRRLGCWLEILPPARRVRSWRAPVEPPWSGHGGSLAVAQTNSGDSAPARSAVPAHDFGEVQIESPGGTGRRITDWLDGRLRPRLAYVVARLLPFTGTITAWLRRPVVCRRLDEDSYAERHPRDKAIRLPGGVGLVCPVIWRSATHP